MSRLRLWLSLLALGFGFWTVGQLVTLRILHRSYQTSRHFIADIQPESTPSRRISAIKVKIYQESGISIAEITSEDPTLLEREFQFTVVTPKDIEQAISEELQIPVKEVRSLIYYRVL
ncbi:MAG: hypothetical protein F6J95_022370 [Leptolyngbya sp. SIO1E4]|nr:hypothetical protein [Leptolyngbya sp. SIO1E4]